MDKETKPKQLKIKTVMISQPAPLNEKSPYAELAAKYELQIDFRPFIHVEGISAREFNQQNINILDHTAVLFTSKTGVDNFFRLCQETRVSVPETMKYFCVSEAIAHYLQKYTVFRKRKIFFSDSNTFPGLMECVKKHKDERYLVPLSDVHKPEIPRTLNKAKIKFTKGIFYKTVSSDLSDLAELHYDMLVFYSPSGIKSLFDNFPDFKQNDVAIGAFGNATAKAVKDAGLRLDIVAPNAKFPSMAQALDNFLSKQ